MEMNKEKLNELLKELIKEVGENNQLFLAMKVGDMVAGFANEGDLREYVEALDSIVLSEEGDRRKFFFSMFLYTVLDTMGEDKALLNEFMQGFARFAEKNPCENIIVSRHEAKPLKKGEKDITLN